MDSTTVIGFIVVIVVAICEALKIAGIPSRFIPIFSVILSIAGAYFFGEVSFLATLAGVIIGLATTGGYRLIKTSILNK